MHVELKIGDSIIMLADEYPGMGNPAPGKEGSPVVLNLFSNDVEDVSPDELRRRAEATFAQMKSRQADRPPVAHGPPG